jgi:acyl-CoA synthetase (NDP forming)
MKELFYPGSVMVVGVSPAAANLGRNIVFNLERFGFRGPVYAVGREGGDLNGRKIYRRIEDINGSPEVAIFLIPARYVPEAMEACGRKGVRYGVIQSGGFSEFSDDNRNLEREVLDAARRWNIRFVGPNCISILNLDNGLALPFVPLKPDDMKKGSLSIAAQSGGIVIEALRLLTVENIGFNKLISMGNKLDLNENDFLEYLISDPGTGIIGMYLENVSDGRRLMDVAAGTDKPIVVLKANTNPISHDAAKFHTAAIAGDDEVVEAALKQAGLHRVRNLHEMMDCFKAFSLPSMKGPRLAVLSRSGGAAVLSTDAAYRYGFELARFSGGFFDVARKKLRAGVIRMTNPLDMGDIFDIDFYNVIVEEALKEKEVDAVVLCHSYVSKGEIEPTKKLFRSAGELSRRYGKPVVIVSNAEKNEWIAMKDYSEFPLFIDLSFALKALSRALRHYRFQSAKASRGILKKNPVRRQGISVHAPRLLESSRVFQLLSRYEVPVASWAVVKTLDDGLNAAGKIGYPVALKVSSPAVLHKTEAKAIRLNIGDPHQFREAFQSMRGDEFLVQKMAPPGTEVIIGGRRDQEFGPVILFGLGGIFVEVLKDAAMRVVPVGETEAREMIDEIKGAPILKGFRGQAPSDIDALVRCLCRVSALLDDHPEIVNIDMNPLMVFAEGEGCVAVDAKMEAGSLT